MQTDQFQNTQQLKNNWHVFIPNGGMGAILYYCLHYKLFSEQCVCLCVCRVSKRAGADPLIQELNVGDAAEPQGRGTGQHICL